MVRKNKYGKFWEADLVREEEKCWGGGVLSAKAYLEDRGFLVVFPNHRYQFDFKNDDILVEIDELGSDFLKMWNYDNTGTFTLCSEEKVREVIHAILYVLKNDLEGAFVECGVAAGGIASLMASVLLSKKSFKHIYLYDTFEGMTEPDLELDEVHETIEKRPVLAQGFSPGGLRYDINMTINGLRALNFPSEYVHIVKGDVRETLLLEKNLPDKISILRLDTDLYDSTLVELEVLFPRLVKGGILILDDYMSFPGHRKAVDEYFRKINFKPFFHRTDFEGRMVIKNF